MEYTVRLTEYATEQIRETVAYISRFLLEPVIARAWSDALKKEIYGLDRMPARFPLVEIEPWKTLGFRKMSVKNHMVYYFVEENTVWVTAVVYGKRDQLNALREMPIER